MHARLKLVEGITFVGESGSGHSIVIDGPPDVGGADRGARPMELMLLGMGGCSAVDVMHILRKARQGVSDCVVEVSAERATEHPKVFTRVHLHFKVTGRGLSASHVERAVRLSAERYCSATIMVSRTAEVSHDFEVIDEDAGAGEAAR